MNIEAGLDYRLDVDPTMFQKALEQVFSNAWNAGATEIEISAAVAEDFLDLRVVDNGSGIDSKIGVRVFEPFFTTQDLAYGAGLGLSVVRGIVTAHGGDVYVVPYSLGACLVLSRPMSSGAIRS